MQLYILQISTVPALLLITWIPINPYSLEDGTSSLADVNVKPIWLMFLCQFEIYKYCNFILLTI